MKKIIFSLALVFISLQSVFGQYYATAENKIWYFGSNAGVDFTSGSPVAISGSMSAVEGTTSVSDAAGNLLFYSEGTQVWNRTGSVMPAGSGIVSYSTASATQGCQAVPVIGTSSQYYLFSLEGVPGGTSYCRLSYCIVDMSLVGGMGDVVAATLGTPVTNVLSEKMITVPGNNCDIWLLVHRKDSAIFLAYNISAAGISAPVVSAIGTFTTAGSYGGYSIGALKASHDRRKLVTANWNSGGSMGIELYDFDPSTGIVSNCSVLNSSQVHYGAEFSPDNSKLYIQSQASIVQYDLSAGSTAAIIASLYTVGSSVYWSALKAAPDGKIYFGGPSGSDLGAITSPNTAGAGCGYNATAVALATGTTFTLGLPSLYVTVGGGDTTFVRHDTTACIPTGSSIIITAPATGATTTTYLWNDGVTTASHTTTSPGTYWVIIDTGGCHKEIDTFVITSPTITITTHAHDTTVCSSVGSLTINAPAGYTSYLWSTGATASSISVTTPGVYYVYSSIDCRTLIDTITVYFTPFTSTVSNSDSGFCFPGKYSLTAPIGFTAYLWDNGTVGTIRTITGTGTYWVTYTGACESHSDSFHITQTSLSVDLGPSSVDVCSNYNMVPVFRGKNATYLWQDGYTGSSYSASRTGTYYVTVHVGNCVASDTVKVSFLRITSNLPDTFLCKGVPVSIPYNITPQPGYTVVWEDGSTSFSRTITEAGTYWVYIKMMECETLDTVRVVTGDCNCWYNTPTAFTPNDDGLNDIIRPNIQPGCTISGYQFSVFNRWGELVFTSDVPAKGWDGKFKGIPVDMGTYYYSLQFFNGIYDKPVKRNGDFVLIR